VGHVFLIVLAWEPYALTFGPSSPAPYLSGTLERKGELLVRYYGVAREELANEIALVSGLGPTAQTAQNCPTYTDVTPAARTGAGQYTGDGCVYPHGVRQVGDELAAKGLTWRAYVDGMEAGGSPSRVQAGGAGACRHPALGAADPTSAPAPGTTLATFRDPFTYFHSVIDSPSCAHEVVGLGGLGADLRSAGRTPALSYIVPSLCEDGREAPCSPGAPAGLRAAEGFLRRVVPEILASPAYRRDGLLVITTDEAPSTGEYADSSSCCSQPLYPGIPNNQPPAGQSGAGLSAPGGGQVGALLLSPYVKPHTTYPEPMNHFSLLRTIEDLFGVARLGYAAQKGVGTFGAEVFSGWGG
jgi:hypothetical protein